MIHFSSCDANFEDNPLTIDISETHTTESKLYTATCRNQPKVALRLVGKNMKKTTVAPIEQNFNKDI